MRPGNAAPERPELAAAEALPLVGVALVARVRLVHAHHDVRLLDGLPEGIELGQRERSAALPRGDRRRVQQERLGAVLDDELELLQGPVEDREADHGRREHGVFVVVGPVLQHPAVEGAQDDLNGVRVVRQPLLHAGGQGGPDERPVDAHVLHEGEARLGVEEGVDGRDAAPVLRVGLGPSGRRDAGEGGVGDEIADLVLERDLGAVVDVDVLDEALELAGDELRQGIGVLVHVVVGVEHRVGQPPLAHVDERIGNVFLSHRPPLTADRPHAAPGAEMLPRSNTLRWADAQKPEIRRRRGISDGAGLGVGPCRAPARPPAPGARAGGAPLRCVEGAAVTGVVPRRTAVKGATPVRQLLSGINVVELSGGIAGSYCGKLFADLGADVVKVEPPSGDELRHRESAARGPDGSFRGGAFLHLNTNKRSTVVEPAAPGGRARLDDLLRGAHLVIEETGRGRLPAWGTDLERPARAVARALGRAHQRLRCDRALRGVRVGRHRRPDHERRPGASPFRRRPGPAARSSRAAPGGQHGRPGRAGRRHRRRVDRHRVLRRLRRPGGALDPPGAGHHAAGPPVPRRRAGAEPRGCGPRDAHSGRGAPLRGRLRLHDVDAPAAG